MSSRSGDGQREPDRGHAAGGAGRLEVEELPDRPRAPGRSRRWPLLLAVVLIGFSVLASVELLRTDEDAVVVLVNGCDEECAELLSAEIARGFTTRGLHPVPASLTDATGPAEAARAAAERSAGRYVLVVLEPLERPQESALPGARYEAYRVRATVGDADGHTELAGDVHGQHAFAEDGADQAIAARVAERLAPDVLEALSGGEPEVVPARPSERAGDGCLGADDENERVVGYDAEGGLWVLSRARALPVVRAPWTGEEHLDRVGADGARAVMAWAHRFLARPELTEGDTRVVYVVDAVRGAIERGADGRVSGEVRLEPMTLTRRIDGGTVERTPRAQWPERFRTDVGAILPSPEDPRTWDTWAGSLDWAREAALVGPPSEAGAPRPVPRALQLGDREVPLEVPSFEIAGADGDRLIVLGHREGGCSAGRVGPDEQRWVALEHCLENTRIARGGAIVGERRTGEGRAIALADLETGAVRDLTEADGIATRPVPAPDGRTVAYERWVRGEQRARVCFATR